MRIFELWRPKIEDWLVNLEDLTLIFEEIEDSFTCREPHWSHMIQVAVSLIMFNYWKKTTQWDSYSSPVISTSSAKCRSLISGTTNTDQGSLQLFQGFGDFAKNFVIILFGKKFFVMIMYREQMNSFTYWFGGISQGFGGAPCLPGLRDLWHWLHPILSLSTQTND